MATSNSTKTKASANTVGADRIANYALKSSWQEICGLLPRLIKLRGPLLEV